MARNIKSERNIPCVKTNTNIINDPMEVPEALNKTFSEIGPNLVKNLPNPIYAFDSYITPAKTCFSLHTVTSEEVLKVLSETSIKKANGLDNISRKLIKEAAPIIAEPLSDIFNTSITSGIFPQVENS